MGRARKEATPGRIAIGTSGWTYAAWRGPFYPPQIPQKKWLGWYATQFCSTEINASFYRTPSEQALEAWRTSTPHDFLFAWKASKFITHWKRLQSTCDNSLALMEQRLRLLGPKVGPILFQLPANFRADRERLAQFIAILPRRRRYAFEFRHPSWFVPPVLDLLTEHDIALCLADHHVAPSPWLATASFVYVRGHGPDGRYRDNYPETTLRAWARDLGRWRHAGRDVFVYFDNDQKSAAPEDARRLAALTGRAPAPAHATVPARSAVAAPSRQRG